jgi:hypothetical protein
MAIVKYLLIQPQKNWDIWGRQIGLKCDKKYLIQKLSHLPPSYQLLLYSLLLDISSVRIGSKNSWPKQITHNI